MFFCSWIKLYTGQLFISLSSSCHTDGEIRGRIGCRVGDLCTQPSSIPDTDPCAAEGDPIDFFTDNPLLPFSGFTWTLIGDASIRSPHTARRLTLEECKLNCEDGTWKECKGFSRYISVADTAPGVCWWVNDTALFVEDDRNNDEALYSLVSKAGNGLGSVYTG